MNPRLKPLTLIRLAASLLLAGCALAPAATPTPLPAEPVTATAAPTAVPATTEIAAALAVPATSIQLISPSGLTI